MSNSPILQPHDVGLPQVKWYAEIPSVLAVPNLIHNQLQSYEWFQTGTPGTLKNVTRKGAVPATAEELQHLFDHLEGELDACGFLRPLGKRPRMVRNIRNIFTRSDLTDQEVRTLRGIISGLRNYK